MPPIQSTANWTSWEEGQEKRFPQAIMPVRCQDRTFAQEVTKVDEMAPWKGGGWKIKEKIRRAFLTPTTN